MTVINTNMKSLIAQNALKVNNRAMSAAMEQLSTGSRINSAKDDAAGLAIGQSMTSEIRGMNMAIRNANDGISMAQTAEGALVEVSNMLQRMRELSVQSASGSLDSGDVQRGYLDTEFAKLAEQVNSILDETKWNGSQVLATGASSFDIQVGSAANTTITIDPEGSGADLSTLDLTGETVGTASDAQTAIGSIDTALENVNTARASLGASVNQLTSVADNLSNQVQNLSESRSRIMDTDYAAATTELARTQIIQQAGMAVLAQANQQPQSVLALLR